MSQLDGVQAGASLGDSALAKLIVAAIKALPGSPNLADLALSPAPGKAAAKPGSKDAKPQVIHMPKHLLPKY